MIRRLRECATEKGFAAWFRSPNEASTVFRLAMLGWYFGWYVKIFYSLEEAFIHLHYPLDHPTFSGWRADAIVLIVTLMAPLATAPLLFRMKRVGLLLVAGVCTTCSFVLLLHVATFNDATYTTSFWSGLWLLWLAWNSNRKDPGQALQARRLSLAIISLIFLGGFVGKLTPEFWSGEMFYHYFFLDREFLFYPWLREVLDPEQLRDLATWFSRFVLVIEGSMIFLWLGPFRRMAPVMILVMSGFIIGSTPWLISVFGALIGMLLANYAWNDDRVESHRINEGR